MLNELLMLVRELKTKTWVDFFHCASICQINYVLKMPLMKSITLPLNYGHLKIGLYPKSDGWGNSDFDICGELRGYFRISFFLDEYDLIELFSKLHALSLEQNSKPFFHQIFSMTVKLALPVKCLSMIYFSSAFERRKTIGLMSHRSIIQIVFN